MKTYKNTALGYSFKYPAGWSVKPNSDTSTIELRAPGTATSELPIGGYQTDKGAVITVYSTSCNNACSLDHTYDGFYSNATNRGGYTLNNGVGAARFTMAYESEPTVYTVFYKNSLKYTITFTSEGDEAASPLLSNYDNLLNSFEF